MIDPITLSVIQNGLQQVCNLQQALASAGASRLDDGFAIVSLRHAGSFARCE